MEIRCTPDCRYLVTARVHPPAVERRRHARLLELLQETLAGLGEGQRQLFGVVHALVARHRARETPTIIDGDLIEAAAATAATLETAARGVIYEHRATGIPAQRLTHAFRSLLDELGARAPASFAGEAAVVFRRIEQAVRNAAAVYDESPTAYLDLVVTLMAEQASDRPPHAVADASAGVNPGGPGSCLILP